MATQRQWATALSLPGLALSLSLFFLVTGW